MIRIWLSVSLLACATPALASPDCGSLQQRWKEKYTADFKIEPMAFNFTCPSPVVKLARTFHDLETIQIATLTESAPLYHFVTSRIRKMVFDPNCQALAREGGGTITICPAFFNDTREDRAATLIHESRHIDASDPGHVNCVGGRHDQKRKACDETLMSESLKGSGYNADLWFYGLAMQEPNSNHELKRAVMQSYVNRMVPDRFNNAKAELIRKWRKN